MLAVADKIQMPLRYESVQSSAADSVARHESVMPLLYFDLNDDDGSGPVRNVIGTEVSDMDAARPEVSRTIAELAADTLIRASMKHC